MKNKIFTLVLAIISIQVSYAQNLDSGKTIKFKFEGNAVGIAVAAGPDAGIIEYKIDNSNWKQKDLYERFSKNLYVPSYHVLASGLKSKKHTLKIRLLNERNPKSNGNSCILRYFFLNTVMD